MCLSIGCGDEPPEWAIGPFSIFSKPVASTQSETPPSTNCLAMNSAVEPVAQLLFTL